MDKPKPDIGMACTKFRAPIRSGVIKNMMEIKGNGHPVSHRLYPRNTPEILVNLADLLRGRLENRTLVADGTTIQGSKKKYMNVEHPADCHFLSIRFTANGFYKLFGIPQKEFTEQIYQMEDVVDDAGNLIPKLHKEQTTQDRLQLLVGWVQKLISKKEISGDLVSDFIINHLSGDPSLNVKNLVEKTGYTRKHLSQRFKEEAGLTIKEYQKIYRIYRVMKKVEDEQYPSWTRLACQFGFYDQSHFIRDFKRFTGRTPTQYSRLIN